MNQVTLKPLLHRNQECIGIYFQNDSGINNIIRKISGARWSQTNKCWWIPLSKDSYNKLFFALKGKVEIEQTALHHYLTEKKKSAAAVIQKASSSSSLITKKNIQLPVKNNEITKPPIPIRSEIVSYKTERIYDVNAHVLPAMKQKLKLKAYSASTIKTYINEMAQLLQTIKNIPADELTPEHLRRYLVYCFEKLQLTENTLHSRINAMKFYYEQVLGREKFFWEIPRPKKQLILPKVLGEDELARLFKALDNSKHKAILFTAYSAGLRVSEVTNLKIKDIDSDRMQIFVESGKGKKDRYVMLSPVLLDILRAYIKQCRPKPQVYLFENPVGKGAAYNIRSAQKVFQMAKEKAGIKKSIGFHSLRHSFATHLLEKGIDIRYIKDLLGHFDIRTTERYLHVKKEQLVNIISPIDDLWEKGKITV